MILMVKVLLDAMSILAAIRDDYIRRFRPRARVEAAHFAMGSLLERVQNAALARTASGRKHKHQWRIPPALLSQFAERLIARLAEISRAKSFAHLLAVVDLAKLKGISELTVYDTALRIGAGQLLEPEEVYLHAGTRKGAMRLGLNVNRQSIPRAEIPSALTGLSPSEVEDLLCSYADYLGAGVRKFLPEETRLDCMTNCSQLKGCE
jgi:hypothetical protein